MPTIWISSPAPGPTTEQGEPQTTTASAPTTDPAPTTTVAPTTTDAPAPEDPVDFVLDYYRLLPGQVDEALSRLGPAAIENSGGEAGYRRFYSTIQTIYAEDLSRTASDTVSGFVTKRPVGTPVFTAPFLRSRSLLFFDAS